MLHKSTIILLLATVGITACLISSCTMRQEGQTTKKTTQQATASAAEKEETEMIVQEMNAEMFRQRVTDYVSTPNEWNFKGDKPAIIDFYATWCGPCKMMSPIVDEMAEKYSGKIDVYKVDIDRQEELAALFGIRSIPTFVFIPADSLPQKSIGAMSKVQFEDAIRSVLKVEP